MKRHTLRPIGESLSAWRERVAPASTLAAVQACWEDVAGAALAAHARPSAERGGVLEVRCDEAVWAAELELMGPALIDALNTALGAPRLTALRTRADGSPAA